MTKLLSWNVNGIRAIIKKNFIADIESLAPDIFCLQETKSADEDVMEAMHHKARLFRGHAAGR